MELPRTQAWETAEQSWWQTYYAAKAPHRRYTGSLARPHSLRQYHRAPLFAAVLPHIQGQTWIDIGAGDSWTIGDLIPPRKYGYRYIATDISAAGLERGRAYTHSLPVQHAASALPFAPGSARVVSGLGVLHHFPDWQTVLGNMISLLEPGGYLVLNEVIDKPRIGGRSRNLFAAQESPHEGQITAADLRRALEASCTIVTWRNAMTPLLVALLVGRLDVLLRRSAAATALTAGLDSAWAATVGRLHPSLGTREVCVLARARR